MVFTTLIIPVGIPNHTGILEGFSLCQDSLHKGGEYVYLVNRESDPAVSNRDTRVVHGIIRERSFPASGLAFGMMLVFAMLIVTPGTAGQGWMFRADEAHTGVYSDSGPQPICQFIWDYYTHGPVSSSPAVVDGAVYVGSNDNFVYALGYKIPAPSFTASPASGPYPLTVTFTDSSTGDITGWQWDFGDGSSSTHKNPVHT